MNPPSARLVFVTGSRAGTSVDLQQDVNTLGRRANQTVVFAPDEILVSGEHADIVVHAGRYVLRDRESRNGTFVNRERIGEKVLEPGDMIEFGVGGPSAQFLLGTEATLTPTLDLGDSDAPAALRRLADERAAARASSGGMVQRSFSTTREFVAIAYQRSSKRTRRTAVALAALTVVAVGAAVYWQTRNQEALQDSLARFAVALEDERGSRAAIERDLTDIQARYDSLLQVVALAEQERRAGARGSRSSRDLAARFSGGVGLIVYSYGYVRRGSTELLRYQVDPQGAPLTRMNRFGQIVPVIDFGGPGPAVQRQGSATGFLVDSAGWVLTNRHVAEPWGEDDGLQELRRDGLDVEPQFIQLLIYFPPGARSHRMRVHAKSPDADVAVMRTVSSPAGTPVLPLATERYAVPPGEEVAFIGYPTGLHNLLFRLGQDERLEILNLVGEEPVELARELARRQQIQPLVFSGSISDTTDAEIIHNADATGGGSGAPLIAANGTVVGIHYAVVRSPIRGDPFQTQRGVRARFAEDILPADVRERLAKQ